jgi:hypothetical protein
MGNGEGEDLQFPTVYTTWQLGITLLPRIVYITYGHTGLFPLYKIRIP